MAKKKRYEDKKTKERQKKGRNKYAEFSRVDEEEMKIKSGGYK